MPHPLLVCSACLACAVAYVRCDGADGAFALRDTAVVYPDEYERIGERLVDFFSGRKAAHELAKALSQATGGEVKAYPEGRVPPEASARHKIYVGPAEAAKAAGFDVAEQKAYEVRIVTKGGDAYVLAKNHVATQYGVTEFLERFADCWYVWLDGRDPVTVDPSRMMPTCDLRVVPAIYSRTSWSDDVGDRQRSRLFRSRTRGWCGWNTIALEREDSVVELPGLRGCHANYCYCPIEKYFKPHPEFYSMNPRGERFAVNHGGSQYCFTNPELLDVVCSNMCNFAEAERKLHPDDPRMVFDFCQQDCSNFMCFCPECKKVIAKYNRKSDGWSEGGDAGIQLEFVNKLARRMNKRYPGTKIRVFAYNDTFVPPDPEKIRADDNVIIFFCDMYNVSDHSLPLAHPFNRAQGEALRTWGRIAKNVEVWDYMLGRAESLDIQVDAMASDARLFRDNHVTSIFYQNSFSHQAFWELNYLVNSRALVNPDCNLEKLIDVYCRGYGAAAKDMRALIDYVREVTLANPPKSAADWYAGVLPWRGDLAVLEKMRTLALAAHSKLPAGVERARAARVLAVTERQLLDFFAKNAGLRDRIPVLREAYAAHAEEGLAAWGYPENSKAVVGLRAQIKDYVETCGMRFDDLPEELKAHEDDLYLYDYHPIQSWGWVRPALATNVVDKHQKFPDPDSPRGVATGRIYSKKDNPVLDFGFNDTSRTVEQGHIERVIYRELPKGLRDGKYHWFKFDTYRAARNGNVMVLGDWNGPLNLGGAYREWDGEPANPNWFDFWISVKVQGPAFIEGDVRRNMICVDRMVLHRLGPLPDADIREHKSVKLAEAAIVVADACMEGEGRQAVERLAAAIARKTGVRPPVFAESTFPWQARTRKEGLYLGPTQEASSNWIGAETLTAAVDFRIKAESARAFAIARDGAALARALEALERDCLAGSRDADFRLPIADVRVNKVQEKGK